MSCMLTVYVQHSNGTREQISHVAVFKECLKIPVDTQWFDVLLLNNEWILRSFDVLITDCYQMSL